MSKQSIRIVILKKDGNEIAIYRNNKNDAAKLITNLRKQPECVKAEMLDAPNWISKCPTHVQVDMAPVTSTKH